MNQAQYDAILKSQKGVCAICRKPSSDGRRLAVDHCHYSGVIRGLLCFHCNTAIGKLGDSAEKVAIAVQYLMNDGEAWLGWQKIGRTKRAA